MTLVARRGRVAHFEAQGLMDLESKTPMRKDAIFRIASMSKPVTGVAILMLMEEGKLRLTDPVSRFIPEFKNMKVAMIEAAATSRRRAGAGSRRAMPEIYTVPADREITIRDLLTHTSGLESGGLGNRGRRTHRAARHERDAGATTSRSSAAVPLDFQPGTQWRYSALAGIDTLGRDRRGRVGADLRPVPEAAASSIRSG